jgi:hypothetical protein
MVDWRQANESVRVTRKGNVEFDGRAFPGLRLEVATTRQSLQAFLDIPQAISMPDGVAIESAAIVSNDNVQASIMLCDLQFDFRCRGMAKDIVQSFFYGKEETMPRCSGQHQRKHIYCSAVFVSFYYLQFQIDLGQCLPPPSL